MSRKFVIPENLKTLALDSFLISKRLSNVLKHLDLKFLGDLERMSAEEFAETRHCGVKTLEEILSLLEDIRNQNPSADEEAANNFSYSDFADFVNRFLADESAMTRTILIERFGGRTGIVKTLLCLGVEQGRTRERIRQILAVVIPKLQMTLRLPAARFFEKLERECSEGVFPITPQLWRERSARPVQQLRYHVAFYLRIMANIAPSIPVFPTEGDEHESSYIDARFRQVYREIKRIASNQSSSPVKEVFEILRNSPLAVNLSVLEFLNLLKGSRDFTLDFSIPRAPTIQFTKTLKTRDIVYAVLSDSECVLRAEEIILRAKKVFGDEVSGSLTIYAVLALTAKKHGFYLLGRRAVGLEKHFALPKSEWDTVRDSFYKLLKKKAKDHIDQGSDFPETCSRRRSNKPI